LDKPAFLVAAKNSGQPHSHFGWDAALPVDKLLEGVARYAEGGGGAGDG